MGNHRKQKHRIFIAAILMALLIFPIHSYAVEQNMVQNSEGNVILAGDSYSLFIKNDGSLWACGVNNCGQLCNGTWEDSVTPVKVMDNVRSVDGAGLYYPYNASGGYSLIVKSDGTLWICGDAGYTGTGRQVVGMEKPEKVLDNVRSASAGSSTRLAVKEDGSLWAWGLNSSGQVGDGTCDPKPLPVKVTDGVKEASIKEEQSYILKEDGSLWACGAYVTKESGYLVSRVRTAPAKIMDDVKKVIAGNYYCYVIKNDNSLWVWGDNYYGDLGDGTKETIIEPKKIMDNVRTVSAGHIYNLALKEDGSVWSWGQNIGWGTKVYGRLGDGTSEDRLTPVKIMDGAAAISAGAYHCLAVKNDGSLWAWGNNIHGEFGNGIISDGSSTPVKVMDGIKVPAYEVQADVQNK